MGRADENKIINKRTLIKTYKEFVRNPKKIFVCTDFFKARANTLRAKYLNTLISLNLIECVSAVYKWGKGYKRRKDIKGYRLK